MSDKDVMFAEYETTSESANSDENGASDETVRSAVRKEIPASESSSESSFFTPTFAFEDKKEETEKEKDEEAEKEEVKKEAEKETGASDDAVRSSVESETRSEEKPRKKRASGKRKKKTVPVADVDSVVDPVSVAAPEPVFSPAVVSVEEKLEAASDEPELDAAGVMEFQTVSPSETQLRLPTSSEGDIDYLKEVKTESERLGLLSVFQNPAIAAGERIEMLSRKTLESLGFDPEYFSSYGAEIRSFYHVLPVCRMDDAHYFVCRKEEEAVAAARAADSAAYMAAIAAGENYEPDPDPDVRVWYASEQDIAALNSQIAANINVAAEVIGESKAAKLFGSIVDAALKTGASDVHVTPVSQKGGIHVRFRVDGTMNDYAKNMISTEDYVQFTNYVMQLARMDVTKKRSPQDGSCMYSWNRKNVELRVASMPIEMFSRSEDLNKLQFRLLLQDNRIQLSELGMTATELSLVHEMARLPEGLVVCTGPTSSGKSTTMYAMLSSMDLQKQVCYTAENPVEYRLEGAAQVSVNDPAGRTYASILRSMMRLDPDIVYIGEVRDQESAYIACQMANTGHTVYTTLHTNNAWSAPLRLVSVGVPEYLVAGNLQGVIAQRLTKANCPKCAVKYRPSKRVLKLLDLPDGEYTRSEGCEECGGKGWKGRIGIYEIFPIFRMRSLLEKHLKEPETLKREARKLGYGDMRDAYLRRIESGATSPDFVAETMTRSVDFE